MTSSMQESEKIKIFKMDRIEKRSFTDQVRAEKKDNEPARLSGRGIVFGEWGKPFTFQDWNGRAVTIMEKIDKKSIEGVDLSDVISYYNHHDPIIGRTAAGTMKLEVKDDGVYYTVDLPDTQAGRDVFTSASRGDIKGSSFQFRAADEEVETKEDKDTVEIRRTITKFALVHEIGPVDSPAYPQTTASVKRDFEDFVKQHIKQQSDEPASTPVKDRKKLRFRKLKLFQK